NQDVILKAISEHLQRELPSSIKNDTVAIRLPDATDQSLQAFQRVLFETGPVVTSSYSNTKNISFVFNLHNELLRTSKNEYNRMINGTIGVNIVSVDGVIIWSTIVDVEHADSVPKDRISYLTTDWKPTEFNKIENRRKGLRFLKLVEPVLISSAVVTTAYLLYNIRSN
ncbi:MAG TPA: hypothetical protein DCE78_11480, partial [Bacteroidetes bacterium]|nr:hypothetical protein [Bacteroidota bacterium]